MASIIAGEARPAIVGVFLATLVLAPWQHGPRIEVVRVPLDDVVRPPVVVAMELASPSKGPVQIVTDLLTHPDVVVPGPHPDAQSWPRGMVITPPPHPDHMAIDLPTAIDKLPKALDKLLSGLVAPWLATAI